MNTDKEPIPMKRISISIPEEEKDFLTNTVIFEDAATNLSEAVSWCIDACMRMEKLYGIDACYISFHDIRLKEHDPATPIDTTAGNPPNCYPEGGGQGEEKAFYCAKPSDIPCSAQCDLCKKYDFLKGPAPEAQPIPDDEEEDDIYDAVRKYRDAHPEKSTPKQPIADGKEVPEEIMRWVNHHYGLWENSKNAAIAMYHKMQEEITLKKIELNSQSCIIDDLKADLLAARNKNNDDGIEIARLLAELKEKELIITGIEEGDEQWKAEYENLLATINKTSRSILNVYAPGNYYCNCCHCGEQFQGDKRAVSCLKCALSGHEKYVDELAERNAKLLAEKKEYAVNEQKIGRNLLDAYRVISGLLPANSQWQEKYIHKCNDLTAMIDEALQKSKELDALAPEIKRQTIDRLYNEILAAGVEFPPAAREVFHRAMNELTASPTSNKDNG